MRHNAAWKAFLFFLCFDIATSAASESVRLYVDNSEGDDVSVIDLKTLDTVNDIRLADKVHGLAIQRDGRRLFATIESDNTLRVVDTATNNVIAKVAHGLTDDLVSLMVCAAACPVVFAPAMNDRMWGHPVAQENVAKLKGLGYRFIGPEEGWLACRNVGAGRLAEVGRIVEDVSGMLVVSKTPTSDPSSGR